MQNIKFDDLVKPTIPSDGKVTLTAMNGIYEIQYMERVNKEGCPIVVLDKTHYYIKSTCEVKEFIRSEIKNNYCSLRRTFKKLRYLINNNFTGGKNELFVTLTYAENMRDTKRLMVDFDNFRNKLKYHYKNNKFDYISIVEPQGRGAWHIHLLMRFAEETYIDNAWLREKWGHGWVTIRRLKNVDNIGAYMTAYLSDLDISNCLENDIATIETALADGGEIIDKDVFDLETGETVSKKVIKGGRLHLYPAGLNLYRKSKGIEYPERIEMKYSEIKKAVSPEQLRYSKGIELLKDDEHFNTIIYEQYNIKNKKSQ